MILERHAGFLSQMRCVRPHILRGVPPSAVLRRAPGAWMHGELEQLYAFSQVTTELTEFWSRGCAVIITLVPFLLREQAKLNGHPDLCPWRLGS